MAYHLRLTDDAEETTLDLLHGTLRVRGWDWAAPHTSLQQKAISLPFGYQAESQGYAPVIESLPLVADGCAEDIRDALATLDILMERAAAHHDDPVVEAPVWLECRSEDESLRRTLVTGGSWVSLPRLGAWPMLDGSKLLITLALTHHPLWETASESQDSASGLSSVGGMWAWTDTAGRVPARLSSTRFDDDTTGFYGGAGSPLSTIWAGWRPEYKGLTNFNPVWECESTATGGGMSTFDDAGATVNLVDGTFHNSCAAHTVFANTTLTDRLHINVGSVNGLTVTGCEDFAGRYVVLCRTWVDPFSGGFALLQMRYGYHDTVGLTACDPVKVDSATPHFKELGTVQIPPPGLWTQRDATNYDQQCSEFTIWLYSQSNDAGAISATTLDMDCLVLIPADYFVKLENAYIYDSGGVPSDRQRTLVDVLPNDRVVGYAKDTAVGSVQIWRNVAVSPSQWYLPTGDSMLVVAAEQAGGQDVDDLLTVEVNWLPRWLNYRD